MCDVYVWTKKAEESAAKLGLEVRRAGEPAYCGYAPVSGQVAEAWLRKGYIKEVGC